MMTMKSGTNQYRGNVFEFLRNDKLNANGFFRNRNVNTAKRLGVKRNVFGGATWRSHREGQGVLLCGL